MHKEHIMSCEKLGPQTYKYQLLIYSKGTNSWEWWMVVVGIGEFGTKRPGRYPVSWNLTALPLLICGGFANEVARRLRGVTLHYFASNDDIRELVKKIVLDHGCPIGYHQLPSRIVICLDKLLSSSFLGFSAPRRQNKPFLCALFLV